jgi:hypothetical protein
MTRLKMPSSAASLVRATACERRAGANNFVASTAVDTRGSWSQSNHAVCHRRGNTARLRDPRRQLRRVLGSAPTPGPFTQGGELW